MLSIGLLVNACQKEYVNTVDENIKESVKTNDFDSEKYNSDLESFAKAVSRSLKSSDDFRKMIKQEALLLRDGDYDVLVNSIMNKRVTQTKQTGLKSYDHDYTVRDLLESSYPKDVSKNRLKSNGSIIDKLIETYPDLQISVPVHAEEWDESSYVPTVTFLPAEYDDASTKIITGFDNNGQEVELDVVNEPKEPVIVVSQNERNLNSVIDAGNAPPEAPYNLTGIQTESGIRLSWEMPSVANPVNTSGYFVYRKGVHDTNYARIGIVDGLYNRSYNDNLVESGASYSYYVMSYNNSGEVSYPSNYITVVAPNNPRPVMSFEAIQNSKNEIELRWQNDHSQYILETRLWKHVIGIDEGYKLYKTFTVNDQDYFDHDVIVGKKVVYKITHVTSMGESNAKYDFVKVPYRDISQKSPVYIKKIKFSDWSIERWPAGKPEFYVTVTNVDSGGKSPYRVQEDIDCQFSSRSSTSQIFTGKKVLDWQPGFWFDMLSFYVVEYDRSWGKLDITASVGYNSKNTNKDALKAVGKVEYKYTIQDKGEKCGNSYLNYFDDPEVWLEFPNYGVKVLVSETDN